MKRVRKFSIEINENDPARAVSDLRRLRQKEGVNAQIKNKARYQSPSKVRYQERRDRKRKARSMSARRRAANL